MKTIPVALALVEHAARWLVNRRLSADELVGLFEFPGGKMRAGETPEDAARRECLEEVCIMVEPFDALSVVAHDYENSTVLLHPIRCRLLSGVPRPNAAGIGEVRWVDAAELQSLAMPPANRAIIDELLNRSRCRNHLK